MTLRTRIIFGYILLVVGAFALIVSLAFNEVRPRYLEAVEESTVDTAELLAAILAQQISGNSLELATVAGAMHSLETRRFSAKIFAVEKDRVDLRVYVTDTAGSLLYDSSGEAKPGTDFSHWRDIALTLRGEYGARSTRTMPEDPTTSVIYVAAPIMKNGTLYGVVTVGKPKSDVAFFIDVAKRKLLLTLGIIGLTAVGLAIAASFWITGPINRLLRHVQRIRQGEPGGLPRSGSPEVNALGAAIAEMQKELEGKNYIEDYVRALTHEMKSPLTGIKGAGEILRDHVADAAAVKFLNNIDSETERLRSLIDRMLQLSRVENIRSLTTSRISVAGLMQTLHETFQAELARKQLELRTDIPSSLQVTGDELLLRQALGNLLANAVDFSPPGACITVTAAEGPGEIHLTIRDHGTGLPDYAAGKIFDKFFSLARPDTGKKSTGLGLPFVKEVISLHNGSVAVRNAHPGLEVEIRLPS